MIITVVRLDYKGNPVSEPFDLEVKSIDLTLIETPLRMSVVDYDLNSFTYIAEQDFLLKMSEIDDETPHSD